MTQQLAELILCKPTNFPIKYLGLPLSEKKAYQVGLFAYNQHDMSCINWMESLLIIHWGKNNSHKRGIIGHTALFYVHIHLVCMGAASNRSDQAQIFMARSQRSNGSNQEIIHGQLKISNKLRQLGGLDIRDIQIANQALMMKWMWQWHDCENTWWRQATTMVDPSDKPWADPQGSTF